MWLTNQSARLITINTDAVPNKDNKGVVLSVTPGKKYKLMPAGPAVEVPDKVCKGKFVTALLQLKSISSSEDKPQAEEPGDDGFPEDQDDFNASDLTVPELLLLIDRKELDVETDQNKPGLVEDIEAALELLSEE